MTRNLRTKNYNKCLKVKGLPFPIRLNFKECFKRFSTNYRKLEKKFELI